MNLKKLRTEKGLTQKELGALTGISDVKISYIENGKIKLENVTFKTILKFAEALDCRPEDLL